MFDRIEPRRLILLFVIGFSCYVVAPNCKFSRDSEGILSLTHIRSGFVQLISRQFPEFPNADQLFAIYAPSFVMLEPPACPLTIKAIVAG